MPQSLRDPCEISTAVSAVHHGFGFASKRRNNLHFLNKSVVLTSNGAAAVVLDIDTKETKYVFCPDDEGVGAICVHPSRKFFAIGGKGKNPNVFIYEFPSLALFQVLRMGTEKTYSCMAFSAQGDKLSTVGGSPDFMLTIWDWESQKITLHNKAFAQEVYNVAFAPENDGILATSGLGHIRFWKMASTFTGLKLQGDIGKFGKVELSDVSAYAIMPDGKVLSGSESGSLLLWDGNFIKLEIRRPGGLLPHDGEIHCCELVGAGDTSKFITGGEDGYLRWWSFSAIDASETTDEEPEFVLKPWKEVFLEGIVPVKLCVEDEYILIQNRNGSIVRIDEPLVGAVSPSVILSGHAGSITGLAISPANHYSATVGIDGVVILWDYILKEPVVQRKFSAPGSCITWVPPSVDLLCRKVIVGFTDGVVRCLVQTSNNWKIINVFKPHSCEITCITFSPDSKRIATASVDGTVFFFNVVPEGFSPLGFVNTPNNARANSVTWYEDSSKVIIACNNGIAHQVTLPVKEPDTRQSYELKDLETRTYTFKRKIQKPPPAPEQKAEEDATPLIDPFIEEYQRVMGGPVGNVLCVRLSSDQEEFILSLSGLDAGPLYICKWQSEYPIATLPNTNNCDGLHSETCDYKIPDYAACTFMSSSVSKKFLINGGADGTIRVRLTDGSVGCYARVQVHDGREGSITGAGMSFDDQFLLTSSNDGSMFVHCLAPSSLESSLNDLNMNKAARIKVKNAQEKGELPVDMIRQVPTVSVVSIPEVTRLEDPTLEDSSEEIQDITDSCTYSIEDDRLKTGEETKEALAELEKQKVRQVIEKLRNDFETLVSQNSTAEKDLQLDVSEFNIDPEYLENIVQQGQNQLDEVTKEMQWDVSVSKVKLEKLQNFYLNRLLVESIELSAFQSPYRVKSFRTQKFSEALQTALAAVKDLQDDLNEEINIEDDEMNARNELSKLGELDTDKTSKKKKKDNHGWEARKAARKLRKEKMQLLLDEKPDENADDPSDVAIIECVMKNMGDYKLKSAKDFQVPVHLQVNAEKKKTQSTLLAESIQALQMSFNNKFLALRELKKRIVESARVDTQRVQQINKIVGKTSENEFQLQLNPAEWPEKRLIYSEAELDAFIKGETLVAVPEVPMDHMEDLLSDLNPSATFLREEIYHHEQVLLYEKQQIVTKNLEAVAAFDQAVYDLRKERADLQTDLVSAQLQQVTLYREFCLLNEFEKKDEALTCKMAACKQQKTEVMSAITNCLELLTAKKNETAEWQEKDRLFMEEYHAVVGGDSNPVNAHLLKIFKRKIKRVKQTEDEDGSESESEEEYDEEEDENMDGGEMEEERCPDGCEESVYERVLELREKRLDQEDVLNEMNKAVEELRKAGDRHQGKQKQIDKDISNTVLEIQAFQNEKQRKLNEVFVYMNLKFSQIACLVENVDEETKEAIEDLKLQEPTAEELDMIQPDEDIDTKDPEIQRLKVEVNRLREELVSVEENLDLDETAMLEREESLAGALERLLVRLWKRRNIARAFEAQKDRMVLPANVDSCLVFGTSDLHTLHSSISVLEEENDKKKVEYKELHQTHKLLKNEKAQKEKEIESLVSKCTDLQMLKFGQVIDLDAIEKLGSSKTVDEIISKISQQEQQYRKQQAAVKKSITNEQETLWKITRENTALLAQIATLTEKQQLLESQLESSSGNQGFDMPSHAELQEAEQLSRTISRQSESIQALKAEILILKRTSHPRSNQNQII